MSEPNSIGTQSLEKSNAIESVSVEPMAEEQTSEKEADKTA